MSSLVLEQPSNAETSYVLLYNVSWEKLEQLDVALTGTSARLTYLDGLLEIMSPLSDDHEDNKKTLAMLLEVYMRMKNIRFYGRGSATIGNKEDNTRREPDESYNLGTKKPIPDLILEITVTSGGINKLKIYQRLGVPEVWFWEDGLLSLYCLQGDSYIKATKSNLLPELNLDLLAKYARMTDQYDAVNEYIQIITKEYNNPI
ncbi:Uma2 family endonuclease [Nostoc sp. LEGE 06077]|uniref:Uma2 family endonuclease n=1 Tax=Nostoc sp. LEGE 06077 TaxID=915325 RepID=UPI00187F4680|nr:Uma2 family endonuclease [Nostoc sp. LEGE 06077]MBE9208784.1 Uma2 family endonuclease [Nostoc sp. LEGE 06077]